MDPQAEARIAALLAEHPQLELIYADSDLVGTHGRRYSPQWKPAWNLDLLYSDPHYSRCYWVRADRCAVAQQGLQAAGESPSPYALLLELGELIPPSCIGHWPEVLSHHQPEPRASEDSAALLQRHLLRHGQRAEVELIDQELGHRLEWSLPLQPIRVSVIVPTRDRVQLLRACLDSLWATTESALQLEVLVVDNGSEDPPTLDYLRQLEVAGKARILRCPGAFNYSALNNAAAAQANGELLLLLNNDIEAIKEGWLKKMAAQALRPEIACVGAQLLYPDGSLQHAGVILGIGGVAGHSHKYMQQEHPGHQGRIQLSHNFSAVTGAVLMIRRQLFAELGGLDADHLHVSYNDIDLCLRAIAAGYRNIYCADAVLVHHESKSRGAPTTRQARAQWRAERELMKDRWGELLQADPAYHPQLSLTEENFSLRLDGPPPAVRFGGRVPEAVA